MKTAIASFLTYYTLIEAVGLGIGGIKPALSLPPPEDTPEEVLRTEIIIEARSPIDGKPLTASEYAELKARLEIIPPTPPQVNPEIQHLIFLLRLSYPLRRIFPSLKL